MVSITKYTKRCYILSNYITFQLPSSIYKIKKFAVEQKTNSRVSTFADDPIDAFFTVLTFADALKSAKSAKVSTRESFYL